MKRSQLPRWFLTYLDLFDDLNDQGEISIERALNIVPHTAHAIRRLVRAVPTHFVAQLSFVGFNRSAIARTNHFEDLREKLHDSAFAAGNKTSTSTIAVKALPADCCLQRSPVLLE